MVLERIPRRANLQIILEFPKLCEPFLYDYYLTRKEFLGFYDIDACNALRALHDDDFGRFDIPYEPEGRLEFHEEMLCGEEMDRLGEFIDYSIV